MNVFPVPEAAYFQAPTGVGAEPPPPEIKMPSILVSEEVAVPFTLLKLLNANDFAGAAAEFDKWDHAGGQVVAGLLRRRQAETALFQDDTGTTDQA